MKIPVLAIMCLMASASCADVFKVNDNPPSGLSKAVAQDSQGHYLKEPLDLDLMSIFKRPYEYERAEIEEKNSRRIDIDATIAEQINKMPRRPRYDLTGFQASIATDPLMLLQYSSPAVADLYKHYHTIAYLRAGMLYADLQGLETRLAGDLDGLRDQDEAECLDKMISKLGFDGDLVSAMLDCRKDVLRGKGVFRNLNPSAIVDLDIFERAMNDLRLRGERKREILEILPKWEILPNGYQVLGPALRIGQVFARARAQYMGDLERVIQEYLSQKSISKDFLEALSLPGVPLTEQHIRDLTAFEDNLQVILKSHLASQLAFAQTMERYDIALEWLRRAIEHPSTKQAYKGILRQGEDFLKDEKSSLEEERARIGQYASAVLSMIRQALDDKQAMVDHMGLGLRQKELEERFSWVSQAL